DRARLAAGMADPAGFTAVRRRRPVSAVRAVRRRAHLGERVADRRRDSRRDHGRRLFPDPIAQDGAAIPLALRARRSVWLAPQGRPVRWWLSRACLFYPARRTRTIPDKVWGGGFARAGSPGNRRFHATLRPSRPVGGDTRFGLVSRAGAGR